MNIINKRPFAFAAGILWALIVAAPASADDIELFVGSGTPSVQARPNILLILDDSGSMDTKLLTQGTYKPGTTYTGGGCDRNLVYWSTSGTPPTCDASTASYFQRSGLKCQAALQAFSVESGGTYRDMLASFDRGTQKRWEALSTGEHDRLVECAEDWGHFGAGSTDGVAPYPRNGDTANPWTSDLSNRIAWGSNPTNNIYWLYDGNWLAWYYSDATVMASRLQVVKDVANNLVTTINGVNVGLMHYIDTGAADSPNGGSVAYAMENVATARAGIRAAINALTPTKTTPLSETYYEAALYFMGGNVDYGLGSPQSVAESRQLSPNQNKYKSPIEFS